MTKERQKQCIRFIHVAKTKLKLSDDEYQAILQGSAGIDSAKEISNEVQFANIRKALNKAGFANTGMLNATISRAKKILGDDWKLRLESYIKLRINHLGLNACNDKELRQAMSFLSTIERAQAKEGK